MYCLHRLCLLFLLFPLEAAPARPCPHHSCETFCQPLLPLCPPGTSTRGSSSSSIPQVFTPASEDIFSLGFCYALCSWLESFSLSLFLQSLGQAHSEALLSGGAEVGTGVRLSPSLGSLASASPAAHGGVCGSHHTTSKGECERVQREEAVKWEGPSSG
jgi:hypothetical protein